MSTVCNKHVSDYWIKASEKVRDALYFEVFLGNRKAQSTYLCANVKNEGDPKAHQRRIMKCRMDVVNLFDTTELPSDFINVKYLKPISLLANKRRVKIDNSNPISHLLK